MQQEPGSSLLLLGQNYRDYGAAHSARIGSSAAAAISVGADSSSPSHLYKHDPAVPNEDALFVVCSENRAAFAVADAHFGPESSHVLMSEIFSLFERAIPNNVTELDNAVRSAGERHNPTTRSETTLTVSIYDRTSNSVFGVSVGDSTALTIKTNGSIHVLNKRNERYVSASTVSHRNAWNWFEHQPEPGDLLLSFTDGVNECHYRNPDTSIRNSDISRLAAESRNDELDAVDRLANLALTGVRGNPGGQDNIAVTAITVG